MRADLSGLRRKSEDLDGMDACVHACHACAQAGEAIAASV